MYNELAKYYDEFMENVDYESWLLYVKSFIKDRKNGIDFACGSGKFTIGLAKMGYNVYGVDISNEMLDQASKNAKEQGQSIVFINGSMENFAPSKKVSFVTAMCDGINYVKKTDKSFKNIYKSLKKDGVFIFDISSEYKLKSVLGNNTFSDSTKNVTYIWHNFLHKKSKSVDMELTFFEKKGGNYIKKTENQVQYIHTKNDIIESLINAGFSNIEIYGEMTKKKPTKQAQRIHFVAHKKLEK